MNNVISKTGITDPLTATKWITRRMVEGLGPNAALLLGLVMGAMLLGGCGSGDSDDSATSGEKEAVEEPGVVALDPEQVQLSGIVSAPVIRGSIDRELKLTGEVEFNRNSLAQLTVPVSGNIREIVKKQGDRVNRDEILLVLQSEEFAKVKSEYLAARERLALADSTYQRLKNLWEDRIVAEQDYLSAQQDQANARINLNTTTQSLLALGFPENEIEKLPQSNAAHLGQYALRAPFSGTLVEQRVSEGERIGPGSQVFLLANLDPIWVTASIYEQDIGRVKPGQSATIVVWAYPETPFNGKIVWIGEALDEIDRTLPIRVEVTNPQHLLKAAMFAEVRLEIGETEKVLTIPPDSLQSEPSSDFVFVQVGTGRYERREVKIGVRSSSGIEVRSGLSEGDLIVVQGAFTLKSELEKGAFGDDD